MCIKYLLLNDFVSENEKTTYKGVFRSGAFNRTEVSPDDEKTFNVWMSNVEKLDDDGFFVSLEDAKNALQKYIDIGISYKLVACIDVTDNDYPNNILPIPNNKFLGFDISDINLYSVLYNYSYIDNWNNITLLDRMDKGNILRTLSLGFFSKNLNENRLIADYEIAKMLVKIEKSIATETPDLNTLHIEDFKIFKLFSIHI